MNRQVQIYRCLKVDDPVADAVLKYGKTMQELYIESQDFRKVFEMLTNNEEIGFNIEVKHNQRELMLPCYDITSQEDYKEGIEMLTDDSYNFEDSLTEPFCSDNANDFIIGQYQAVVAAGRKLGPISLDEIFMCSRVCMNQYFFDKYEEYLLPYIHGIRS